MSEITEIILFRKKLLKFLGDADVVVINEIFPSTWGRYVIIEVNGNRYLTRTSDGNVLLIITTSNVDYLLQGKTSGSHTVIAFCRD